MKLLDFVVPEAIIVDLQATDRDEAIREIIQSLHDAGQLQTEDLPDITRAILNREALGSTAIGNGLAVPHSRHAKVSRLICAIALSRNGVDFNALDRERVDILFLLLSPQPPGEHLRALERISRQLKIPQFVSFLRQAKDREAVLDLLKEYDQKVDEPASS